MSIDIPEKLLMTSFYMLGFPRGYFIIKDSSKIGILGIIQMSSHMMFIHYCKIAHFGLPWRFLQFSGASFGSLVSCRGKGAVGISGVWHASCECV